MPSERIQWFPGHMAKTRRLISENLKYVDLVIEILDARIPKSSRNPEIRSLIAGKPSIILLNKSSMADERMNSLWMKQLNTEYSRCILTDCIQGQGLNQIVPAIKDILQEKTERYEMKGMIGRKLKAMVLGIPNVGKSSLINRISGNAKAKVENRPGVTLNMQWIPTKLGIDLLDMPGILWPKFDDRTVAENLAITGAIKDEIMNIEDIATALCGRLRTQYPELLKTRYKLESVPSLEEMNNYELLLSIGRKRGLLMAGNEVDEERTSNMLINEFRLVKIGRITLDRLESC